VKIKYLIFNDKDYPTTTACTALAGMTGQENTPRFYHNFRDTKVGIILELLKQIHRRNC
jgi:hypothetical protein